MYDSKLGDRIEKFLKHNEGTDFKSGDIFKALHLKKHKRRDMEDTLRKLKQKRRISGKNKRYYLDASSLSQEYIGIFDARPLAQNRSFAFVLQDKGDIYISREDIMNAYHGDEVSVGIKYEGKDKLHGYITGIRKRARENVVGRIDKYHGRNYLIPDNSLLHSDFEIYDVGAAVPGDKIVCQITNWGDPDKRLLPGCKVIDILGKAGEPDVEIMSVICEYNLPLEFPESVMNEVLELTDGITEEVINDRIDLRNIFTITIDPASARDYDDAISLERLNDGYRLYVHIADVANYVKINSALFEEALQRGNSYYFPRKVLPMLPEKLSNGICSLRPDEDKLTLTVISDYDQDGYISDQKVVESVITSNARLAYEEVDAFMENRDHILEEDTQKLILLMQELSVKLQKTRIERGYLSLDMPETEYIFDEEGHVTDLQRTMETESHQMIENFMLSANEYVAVTLSQSATLYRVHEAPSQDQLNDIKRLAGIYDFSFDLSHTINKAFQVALESLDTGDRHRVFDRVLLRHMKKARYDVINMGHFGLALQNYTHFTSPIRRICDLVVHHQIKALIKNSASDENLVFTRSKLEDIAVIATDKEKLADTTEREVDTKNKLLFMKKRIGEEYSGVVIAVKAKGIIIEIDKYPVNGIVPISSIKDDHYEYHAAYDTLLGIHKAQSIRLADRFNVILVKVDEDIIFEIKDK